MSLSRTVVILCFLILLFTVAEAHAIVPVTGKVAAVNTSPHKTTDILPLPVHATENTTLRAMDATSVSAEVVLKQERDAYAKIHARWVNASTSERNDLQSQVSDQRRRLLLATLNRITAIYQRMDVIISTMDTSVIRLRSMYSSRGKNISDFDSRHHALQSQLAALRAQSDAVAKEIAQCSTSVELSACVQSSRNDASALLSSLRTFFSSYRELALTVVQ